MTELDKLLNVLDSQGVDRAILADSQTAHMMANGHKLLSLRQVPGVTLGVDETADGIVADIRIARGMRLAQPLVKVTHPRAKVTHEAAIGSVDHHQMETLMANGLSPEQAVDLIVGGLLGKMARKSVVATNGEKVIAWKK